MVKKILKKFTGILLYLVSLILIIVVIAMDLLGNMFQRTVNVYLGQKDYEVQNTSDVTYYESDYDSHEELVTAEELLCKEIEEEGIVLLKNNEEALPLENGAKVSLLGQDSVDLVYGGAGSGSIDTTTAATLKEAMESSGFEINSVLWDFYETGEGAAYRKVMPNIAGSGGFEVNEVPLSVYTDSVKESFEEYNDAAIVFLGRVGSESTDLPFDITTGENYLELTSEEEEMIQMAVSEFDKVIVVINSANAMELGFLDEYDVDACIWIGSVGQTGIDAVGEVLSGQVNPSGKLTDTYVYDNMSAPSVVNLGDYTITNSEVVAGNKYLVYSEGIYVGYRYYETRYEDVVLGNDSSNVYDYQNEVLYPFGYGLSYTSFEWSDYTVTEGADFYEVTLTVTNTGEVAGKDVVQIYLQNPYTEYDKEYDIEKASVELVGFSKTDQLDPGESQKVTIEVEKESLKTYDSNNLGTYIVDAGTYYLTAGQDAHSALNNILTAKGSSISQGMDQIGREDLTVSFEVEEMDSQTYSVSQETGNVISNQFEKADISYYDDEFVYLSRKDWEGTWPSTYSNGELIASEEMLADLEISTENIEEEYPITDTISSEYGELSIADLIGVEYDDPKWDALLNQMSRKELYSFVSTGGYSTIALESIGLPGTLDSDGPAGLTGTLMGGGIESMSYPAEVVLASTWNTKLAERMGILVGEDGLYNEISVWYAPAMDIHRTAFSGRNFEYYSEDSFLSGKMGAAETTGAQAKGLAVMIKHFALNDQETNRIGGAVFSNEQAIRELYLEPFEISVREGQAKGAMVSMNRIGTTWVGGHEGLITNTLRLEWGFDGYVMTDQASFSSFDYCDIIEGLEAGTNLWLNLSNGMWNLSEEELTASIVNDARDSVHSILYVLANTNAMNGLSTDSEVVSKIPAWRYIRILLNVILLASAAGLIVLSTKKFMRNGKKREKRRK